MLQAGLTFVAVSIPVVLQVMLCGAEDEVTARDENDILSFLAREFR